MKKIIINYFIALLLLTGVGCKKIADFNVDPNNPSLASATPQLLFPSAVGSTAGQIHGEYAITGGLWAQYYTQSATASQYRTIDAYNLIPDDFRVAYQELYRSALSELLYKNGLPFLVHMISKDFSKKIEQDFPEQAPCIQRMLRMFQDNSCTLKMA